MIKRAKSQFIISVILLSIIILSSVYGTVITVDAAPPISTVGFGGKQWNVTDSNGAQMTLLLASGYSYKDGVYCGNNYFYNNNIINQAMKKVVDILVADESTLINPRTLNPATDEIPGTSTVTNQLFWPLSKSEFNALDAAYKSFAQSNNRGYWLRTSLHPSSNTDVYYVDSAGNLQQGGSNAMSRAFRPAFYLNTSRTLFTSDADNGVKNNAPGSTFHSLSASGAQKFTMVGGTGLSIGSASLAKTSVAAGESIALTFSGITTGAGKYVSAILVDGGGNAVSYAKLSTSASGTVNITIPSGIASGAYTLKVFNEMINNANFTDFASNPINIPVTISGGTASSQPTSSSQPTTSENTNSSTPTYPQNGNFGQPAFVAPPGSHDVSNTTPDGTVTITKPDGDGSYISAEPDNRDDGYTTNTFDSGSLNNNNSDLSSGTNSGSSSSNIDILSGTNQSWSVGDNGITLRIDAEFSTFQSVAMDETTLTENTDYTVTEGSTIVTLPATYLKSLSKGQHTITINFTTGHAQTGLNIVEAKSAATGRLTDNPRTGRNAMIWLLPLVILASLTISLFTNRRRKVRK